VPKAAIVASVVIVLVIAGAIVASVMVAQSRLLVVPDVVGLPDGVAQESLQADGFLYEVAGTRVSVSVPAGEVISQEPAAGTAVDPGTVVAVVLSVGPQSFEVPDLVGSSVDGARDALSALGLTVVTEAVSAETTESIVLEMYPAPGSRVSPGDEIRLSVPGGSGETDVLLPYDLAGVTVLLDPAPVPAGVSADVTMEISRRLQSLLEAAGAKVSTTRAATGDVSVEDRVLAAESSSADLVIGLDVAASGTPGVVVYHLGSAADAQYELSSLKYAQAVTRAATLPALTVNEPGPIDEAVLSAFPGTGIRVQVGVADSASDMARFADPAWADQIARAIYRGVGPALGDS
jgi:N-acetylmuramoyl-L-alanine amidase